MGLGDDSQVLDEGASASFVIVDVLVDGLVADGEAAVHPQEIGNLLWAPVQLQESNDVFPEVRAR